SVHAILWPDHERFRRCRKERKSGGTSQPLCGTGEGAESEQERRHFHSCHVPESYYFRLNLIEFKEISNADVAPRSHVLPFTQDGHAGAGGKAGVRRNAQRKG